MRCCDSLPPTSPRFVSFAWRYHRCVRCSSPPAPDAEPWINLELVGGISSRRARWKRQGLPSSRRNPCDHSPYSSDPDVTRQAEWTMSKLPGAAPATDHDEGSPRVVISGLNRTAFDLAVYASQGWSPTHHARLASGCWSSSTGRDWLPAGFHLKGFKLMTILPSRAFLARGQPAFATEGVVDRPEESGARGENRDDQLGQAHGEGVDVPGGVAEEAMKPRPVPVADTATGEDDFGHVAVTLRDDPARDDHHECLVGRGRENRSEVL